jgi:hypothetical protein
MPDHRPTISSKFAGRCAAIAFALTGSFILAPGCTSDDSAAVSGMCPDGGGPMGTAADHCMGMTPQTVGACEPLGAADAGDVDAGPLEPLPGPHEGSANSDDDCKYYVSFTNDCVQVRGPGTTFTVTLTSLTNNMAKVPGAKPYIESYLGNRPAETANSVWVEISPGVYTIGPVIFPVSGQWTVRFHFFGDCDDGPEDSPHGHAAFLITVP